MYKYFNYYDRIYKLYEDGTLYREAYEDTRIQKYDNKIITLHRHNKQLLKKPYIDEDSYANVELNCKPHSRTYRLHHLVYLVFCANICQLNDNDISYNYQTKYCQINHIDGHKLNNHYLNLELVTLQDNINHAVENKIHNSQIKAKYVEIYRFGNYIDTIWKTRQASQFIEDNYSIHINSADISILARNGNTHWSGFSFKYKV